MKDEDQRRFLLDVLFMSSPLSHIRVPLEFLHNNQTHQDTGAPVVSSTLSKASYECLLLDWQKAPQVVLFLLLFSDKRVGGNIHEHNTETLTWLHDKKKIIIIKFLHLLHNSNNTIIMQHNTSKDLSIPTKESVYWDKGGNISVV